MKIRFSISHPTSPDVRPLLTELSATLARITGSSGDASFSDSDMLDPRAVFIVGRFEQEVVACGALRKVDDNTCELKRMYVRTQRSGIGGLLLAELERRGLGLSYKRVVLETRKVNQAAVNFYLKQGYRLVPNYGKYVGKPEAVCFGKDLETK